MMGRNSVVPQLPHKTPGPRLPPSRNLKHPMENVRATTFRFTWNLYSRYSCLNEENEKIGHNLELFSSPQEWGEQQRPSYFFIRSGDGCGPFPEPVTARRARRFIHQSSQLHRLFILPWRPTSEARPIKFSHFCPNACHSVRIGRGRSSCLALRPASHSSWSPPLCSITFLTSNEEWTFFRGGNYDVLPRSRLQIKCTFWSRVNTQKEKRMWREPRKNVNSTLSNKQHKSTGVPNCPSKRSWAAAITLRPCWKARCARCVVVRLRITA